MRGRHHKKRTKERKRRARRREMLMRRGEFELRAVPPWPRENDPNYKSFQKFQMRIGAPIRLLEEDSLKGFYEHFHVEKKAAAIPAMDWGKLLHTFEEAKCHAQATQTPLLLPNQSEEPQGHLAPRRGRARTCHIALGVAG